MIECHTFGKLPDERTVTAFRITNGSGAYVELLNFGAAIHKICVPDAGGRFSDVVLGVADAAELCRPSYEGVTIGRCANRIARGRFTLNGCTVQLECNRNGHYLHGAGDNYAYQLFQTEVDAKAGMVRFFHRDSGACGFGDAVDVSVSYSWSEDNALTIEYNLLPEADTILCPTNHAYFNLDGTGEITGHLLALKAGNYAKKGELGMPMGEIAAVSDTALDFRRERSLHNAVLQAGRDWPGQGPAVLDESLILDQEGDHLASTLRSPLSGRRMDVYTDMPGIVLFTPYCRTPRAGKDGAVYERYCGICLETQFIPNAVNCPQFKSPIVRAGERLLSRTVYQFGIC